MDTWIILQETLILLVAATILGALFNRFKQDAVLGYLLAGAVLGPHAFNALPNRDAILTIAEIGVALLLFSIGMEFSWSKLRRLGPSALGSGVLQILGTAGIVVWIGTLLGLDNAQAVAVGGIVALSSTALVMRLLSDRTEIDSQHGRGAVGILLVQDIAVVPLVVVVTALGGDSSAGAMGWALGKALLFGGLLVVGIFLLLTYVFPRFATFSSGTNRDLPALLAVTTAIGCAWGAHALGLSPLLGAFAGGVMLAESPFGTQVRADLSPIKAVFVTLFFAAIGTLTNPQLVIEQWSTIGLLAIGIVLGKAAVVFGIALLFRSPIGAAVATGLCLAQIGEFSFVLLDISRNSGLVSSDFFELMVTVTVLTLFASPYLVAFGSRASQLIGNTKQRHSDSKARDGTVIVLVGFGPAGQSVACRLRNDETPLVVIEQNPKLASEAKSWGIEVVIGDATRTEVLERAGVVGAAGIGVTIPDPNVAQQIIAQVRFLAKDLPIISRSRYQRYGDQLHASGATVVSDEETLVGLDIASELKKALPQMSFGSEEDCRAAMAPSS